MGDKLFVQSEDKVTPVTTSPNGTITRDGKKVKLGDIKNGDWVMMTVNHDGTVQKLDAMTDMELKPAATAPGADWARVAGAVVPVIVKAVMRSRKRDAEDGKRSREKNKKRNTKGNVLLRRKPSH